MICFVSGFAYSANISMKSHSKAPVKIVKLFTWQCSLFFHLWSPDLQTGLMSSHHRFWGTIKNANELEVLLVDQTRLRTSQDSFMNYFLLLFCLFANKFRSKFVMSLEPPFPSGLTSVHSLNYIILPYDVWVRT